ncbi:MAG: cysteine methyltransferase [Sulfobacillus benefaciens]|uniref:methylated-DNA--[protein]-cysteine S-methyltransferase n=1 Tax=Sulfobacillus benefaciens TaxID=453960 RepID=A0A2T2XDA8_9FIRM|nr:MAG: cysteine methyltransferase [Sulfobacillus benefaciens]
MSREGKINSKIVITGTLDLTEGVDKMAGETAWGQWQHQGLTFHLAATEQGLAYLGLPNESEAEFYRWIALHLGITPSVGKHNEKMLTPYIDVLEQYMKGQIRVFDVQLDLHGTPFQKSVWTWLTQIPYGYTRSYGDVARGIGRPTAARAVAQAVGHNPIAIIVPCHRVIGSDGGLVGYGGGLALKTHFLRLEGLTVENGRVNLCLDG